MRVCDYPTIQDAVGEAIMDTNASRCFVSSVAQAMDNVTDGARPIHLLVTWRGNYLHWLWQIKFNAAKNVAHVVDKMLHCCGGTGYKKEPLQLERYLRDGKAGWVMGPTTRCCASSSARPPCWAWTRSTTGTSHQRAGAEQRAEEVLARAEAELAERSHRGRAAI
jgi:alkylation response protein AidB-like acyl-CoA dehydrogenase